MHLEHKREDPKALLQQSQPERALGDTQPILEDLIVERPIEVRSGGSQRDGVVVEAKEVFDLRVHGAMVSKPRRSRQP
jgi:hypothetical protein